MLLYAGGIFAMYSLMCKRLGIGQYAHRIPTDVDKARCVLCLCLFVAGSYSLVCHLSQCTVDYSATCHQQECNL